MRFFTTLVAFAGAISSAVAGTTSDFFAITSPGLNEKVQAGTTYTVSWSVADKYADQQVTIGLLGGADGGHLSQIASLGSTDGSSGKFSWSVDSSLGEYATYGLIISLSSDSSVYQYSTPFSIEGGTAASSTPTPSSSKTSATPTPTPSKTTSSSSTSTTSTSTTSSESSSTSTSESSSSTETTSATETTMVVVTTKDSQTSSSTSTPTPSNKSDEVTVNNPFKKISTAGWIGIAAGGVAALAVLLGMVSMCFKMCRRREQERYRDLDQPY